MTSTPSPDGRRLVDLTTAAAYASVSRRTVRRWIDSGKVPPYHVGARSLRVDLNDVDTLIRRAPDNG